MYVVAYQEAREHGICVIPAWYYSLPDSGIMDFQSQARGAKLCSGASASSVKMY